MQSRKQSLIETGATFINDNFINLFLVFLATKFYKVELISCFEIVLIGQTLNVVCTYIRRRIFNKILISKKNK